MRRLRALVTGLPADCFVWRRIRMEPAPVEESPSAPKKVDYAALRALGGEVITIPRTD